jgi:hypothetical protein
MYIRLHSGLGLVEPPYSPLQQISVSAVPYRHPLSGSGKGEAYCGTWGPVQKCVLTSPKSSFFKA